MGDSDDAIEALRELLRIDPGLARAPDRLARALLDLLPYDERTVRLLRLAAELGVPELVAAGVVTEARNRLVDQGLRPDVAAMVTDTWSAVLGSPDTGDAAWGLSWQATEDAGPVRSAEPGVPLAIRLAVWPDGGVLLATIGEAGIFAAALGARAADTSGLAWRQVATVQAANSRDVAVGVRGEFAVLVWSDAGGLSLRGATRAGDTAGLVLRDPHLLSAAAQPRYPVSLLVADESTLDVFWTLDRRQLRRTTVRDWQPAGDHGEVPSEWRPGERVRCLDVAGPAGQPAWLVALTDQSRLLVTRWDLALDDVARWRPVPPPAGTDLIQAAIVALPGGARVVATTTSGELYGIRAAGAFTGRPEWHRVVRPDNARSSQPRSLAAGSSTNGNWLAVCAADGGWLARLGEHDGVLRLSRALPLLASPA